MALNFSHVTDHAALARDRHVEAERARARHFDATLVAALAAIRQATGTEPTPIQQLMARDVARLASNDPLVTVEWVQAGSAVKAVMQARGLAIIGRRTVLCPPLVTSGDYATAGHEVGHVRDGAQGRRLEVEVRAWEWALRHLRCWDEAAHNDLRSSLTYNLKNEAERIDALDAVRAQALMSPETYRANARPFGFALKADEVARFRDSYGRRDCVGRYCSRPPREACKMVGGITPLCRSCHTAHEVDMSLASMKRERTAGR